MPYLNRSDSVRIYFETHGPNNSSRTKAPILLLSHGYSSTSQMWQGQIGPLSNDHRLIVWDMRGHGKSSSPPDPSLYSEAHTVADMHALLTHAATNTSNGAINSPTQIPKTILGGLSLGGYMSLSFHAQYPHLVSSLLIISTGPGFKNAAARSQWNSMAHRTAATLSSKGLSYLSEQSPERAQVQHSDVNGLVLAAKGMLTQRDDRVIKSLPEIKVPCIVIVGEEDTPFLAGSDYMSKKIPRSRKVVIPRAGHACNVDQPEVFNGAVLKFLEELQQDEKIGGGKARL